MGFMLIRTGVLMGRLAVAIRHEGQPSARPGHPCRDSNAISAAAQSVGDLRLGEALTPGRWARVSWGGTVNRRGDLLDAAVRVAGEEFDRLVEPVPGRAADPHGFDGAVG